jgi:hypothetical protein
MEVIKLLSLRGFAKRAGLVYGTVNRYYVDGRLPDPDAMVGEDENDPKARPAWHPATVDKWLTERPGRGARTDLV